MGSSARDERRPPPRREAGRAVERAEAGEPGVDDPQLSAGAPGHLVDLDVARDVAGAGQEAGVVPAGRVELGRHGRDIDELPDLDLGADGQPVAGQGHAHRGLEAAEVGVEVVPLVADHHELAGLVGGDQQRRAELPQKRGEVWRVDRPQRHAFFNRGASVAGVCPLVKTAVDMMAPLGVVHERASGEQKRLGTSSVRGDGVASVRDFYIFCNVLVQTRVLPTRDAARPAPKPTSCGGSGEPAEAVGLSFSGWGKVGVLLWQGLLTLRYKRNRGLLPLSRQRDRETNGRRIGRIGRPAPNMSWMAGTHAWAGLRAGLGLVGGVGRAWRATRRPGPGSPRPLEEPD